MRIGDFQYDPDVLGHRSIEDCGGRDIDAAIIDRTGQAPGAPAREESDNAKVG